MVDLMLMALYSHVAHPCRLVVLNQDSCAPPTPTQDRRSIWRLEGMKRGEGTSGIQGVEARSAARHLQRTGQLLQQNATGDTDLS